MATATWRQRLGSLARAVTGSGRAPSRRRRHPPQGLTASADGRTPYPGDFGGTPRVEYDPIDDGDADPGEVVWAWVPYEEDSSQGKDRPVVVIGRDGRYLLALAFTSKDHHRDVEQEARAGRLWADIGTGAWDPTGRPSEVRLDRVLRLDPAAVRREGATLDRARFDALAVELRRTGNGR